MNFMGKKRHKKQLIMGKCNVKCLCHDAMGISAGHWHFGLFLQGHGMAGASSVLGGLGQNRKNCNSVFSHFQRGDFVICCFSLLFRMQTALFIAFGGN